MEDLVKSSNMFYHGILGEVELARLHEESDILVYPSNSDTYSLVVLQVLSSGLYVLASDQLRGNFDDLRKWECWSI